MIGGIQVQSFVAAPRPREAEAGARPVREVEPDRRITDGADRSAPARRDETDDTANSIRPGNPGGSSAFEAQVAAQQPTAAADPDEDRDQTDRARSEDEQRELRDLAARDREVRAHEAAHAAAGGKYAGAPQYSYERGPNGRLYATGGEVAIDASEVQGDPQATIQKLRTVKRAALAPVEPSAQDLRVAQAADAKIQQAQAELRTDAGTGDDANAAAENTESEPVAGADSAQSGTLRPAADADRQRRSFFTGPGVEGDSGDRSGNTARRQRPGSNLSLSV